MSLVRMPLALAVALAFHVSMSPPSTSDSGLDGRRASTTARVLVSTLTKGFFWAATLSDTVFVLAPYVPTSLRNALPPTHTILSWIARPAQWGPGLGLALNHLPTSISLPFCPPLPLVTVTGTTLALAGAYLRYTAYNALGQFYACPNGGPGTCAPRHAHALITTGPYAFVRHPGYAGLMLCTAGLAVLQLDALAGGGRGTGVGAGMRAVALVCAILATIGALRRIRNEERSLRTRFKGEWEAWAETVRYKLVPGVF